MLDHADPNTNTVRGRTSATEGVGSPSGPSRGRPPQGERRVIRLVVADDHPIVLEGLCSMLEAESDLAVVAKAKDGEEAIALSIATAPDVVLLDVQMPRCDGIEALREVRRACPNSRVIMLTTFGHANYMDSSSDRGAFEYLLKDVTRDNLVEAVRRAARGVAAPTEAHRQDPVARLTEREREVLILMAGGMANRAIAAELGIGEETIKSHVKRVLRKLKARDRTSAVLRSWHLGLLPPDAMVAEVVPEPASECGAESDLRCGSPPAAPGPVPVAPRAQ